MPYRDNSSFVVSAMFYPCIYLVCVIFAIVSRKGSRSTFSKHMPTFFGLLEVHELRGESSAYSKYNLAAVFERFR